VPESKLADRIPLTILLEPELAMRLRSAAEARKRSVTDMVLDLLDRNLPPAGGSKKGKIPYT
jgi:hypothetical protein